MASVQILFKKFCDLCEEIKSKLTPTEKEATLHKFIIDYKKSNSDTGSSFYPILRLLVPQYERNRGPYGLKETNFSRLLRKSLTLSNGDASNLEQYNKFRSRGKACKDFADVVYWVLKKYCPATSNITIADVNDYLDNIATKHAEHKPREIEKDVFEMSMKSTAIEQKWIIRIILKDLKLGMGNDRILRVFHPDAVDFYDVCNDLLEVCKRLKDRNTRLHELEISVFTAFRPMLSLRCDTDVLDGVVKERKKYYVENKFDGERFQLHMKDGVFQYFSKNGYPYKDVYGENYDSDGLITPYLRDSFKDIKSIILDGEMMGWNTKTNKFGSKGMNFDVKKLNSTSVHRPCYCVFDVLLHDDVILTNKPLHERLKILETLFTPIEGVIMRSEYVQVTSKEELLDELNKTVDKQEEGICFKDPDSIYKPNNRRGGWWKMKLEYFDGLMTELDLLIIGANYGDSGSVGKINSFLLGVAVDPDIGDDPTEFYSFAKVASGLTAADYKKVLQTIGPHLKPVDKNSNGHGGLLWKKEKPDVWIEPSKSCVLQIRASELVQSSEFKTEYTLRFPRVEKVRDDKPWYNSMTLNELNELTKSNKAVEKLSSRHITSNDVEVVPKKRFKKAINQPPLIDTASIKIKSTLLKNKEIYVLNGSAELTKQNVEMMIYEHSGNVVQFLGPKTYCILTGQPSPLLPLLTAKNTHDIVKLESFLKVLENSDKILKWKPCDMIAISAKTKLKFSAYFDKYGDSYMEPISDRNQLKSCMDNIDNEGDYLNLMSKEMNEFDKLIFYKNPLALFRMCVAYFDKYAHVNDESQILNKLQSVEHKFRYFGGSCSSVIDCDVTHIVLDSSDLSRLEEIKRIMKTEELDAMVVVENWILESLKVNVLMSEEMYGF